MRDFKLNNFLATLLDALRRSSGKHDAGHRKVKRLSTAGSRQAMRFTAAVAVACASVHVTPVEAGWLKDRVNEGKRVVKKAEKEARNAGRDLNREANKHQQKVANWADATRYRTGRFLGELTDSCARVYRKKGETAGRDCEQGAPKTDSSSTLAPYRAMIYMDCVDTSNGKWAGSTEKIGISTNSYEEAQQFAYEAAVQQCRAWHIATPGDWYWKVE